MWYFQIVVAAGAGAGAGAGAAFSLSYCSSLFYVNTVYL